MVDCVYVGGIMEFKSIKEFIKLINDSKIIEFQMKLDYVSLKIKKGERKLNHINNLKSKEYSMIKLNNVIEENALDKETSGSYIISPVVGIYY